jgi:hypothetical protein
MEALILLVDPASPLSGTPILLGLTMTSVDQLGLR